MVLASDVVSHRRAVSFPRPADPNAPVSFVRQVQLRSQRDSPSPTSSHASHHHHHHHHSSSPQLTVHRDLANRSSSQEEQSRKDEGDELVLRLLHASESDATVRRGLLDDDRLDDISEWTREPASAPLSTRRDITRTPSPVQSPSNVVLLSKPSPQNKPLRDQDEEEDLAASPMPPAISEDERVPVRREIVVMPGPAVTSTGSASTAAAAVASSPGVIVVATVRKDPPRADPGPPSTKKRKKKRKKSATGTSASAATVSAAAAGVADVAAAKRKEKYIKQVSEALKNELASEKLRSYTEKRKQLLEKRYGQASVPRGQIPTAQMHPELSHRGPALNLPALPAISKSSPTAAKPKQARKAGKSVHERPELIEDGQHFPLKDLLAFQADSAVVPLPQIRPSAVMHSPRGAAYTMKAAHAIAKQQQAQSASFLPPVKPIQNDPLTFMDVGKWHVASHAVPGARR